MCYADTREYMYGMEDAALINLAAMSITTLCEYIDRCREKGLNLNPYWLGLAQRAHEEFCRRPLGAE